MKLRVLLVGCMLLTTQLLFAMEKRNNKQGSDVIDQEKVVQAVLLQSVKDFLHKKLDREGRHRVGEQISDIEHNWPHTGADIKPLETKPKMFELRTDLPDSRSLRMPFLARNEKAIFVNAFFKHANIQLNDINLAQERARQYLLDNEKHKDRDNKNAPSFKKMGTKK